MKFSWDTGSATTAFDIDFVEFNYKKPTLLRRLRGIGANGFIGNDIFQFFRNIHVDLKANTLDFTSTPA